LLKLRLEVPGHNNQFFLCEYHEESQCKRVIFYKPMERVFEIENSTIHCNNNGKPPCLDLAGRTATQSHANIDIICFQKYNYYFNVETFTRPSSVWKVISESRIPRHRYRLVTAILNWKQKIFLFRCSGQGKLYGVMPINNVRTHIN
jgi:hypothetical protein